MEWEKVGLVKASQHRQSILKIIAESSITPKEIATTLGIHLSQVTRSLREMEKQNIVHCLTPNLRKGRIYAITEEGLEILDKITPNTQGEG